jgi:hypothetical protein
MALQFKKATKQQSRLRLALIGPAGGGKTFTALKLATYLASGGSIAVMDTERGSASKYAGEELADGTRFQFDVIEPESFSPETYVEVIRAAESAGYKVLVIDSLSHAWMGKDGALEKVDNAAKRERGNSFAAWRNVTPLHNAMVDAIINSSMHIIATMRTKTEYVVEKDEKSGKSVPRKIGMQPVQRDGLEYEFDVVADLDQDNNLIIGKTRCSRLTGKVFNKAGREVAEILTDWLTDGEAAPAAQAPTLQAVPSRPQASGSDNLFKLTSPPVPEFTVDSTGEMPRVFDPGGQEITDPVRVREITVREIVEVGRAVGKSRTDIDLRINQQLQTKGGLDSLGGEFLVKTLNHYRDVRERMELLASINALVVERSLDAQLTAIMTRDYEGRDKKNLTALELSGLHAALEREAAESVF